MTDGQRRTILDEIAQYTERPVLEADEITAFDLAQKLGVNQSTASARLQKLVDQGVMTVRRGVYDARTGKILNGLDPMTETARSRQSVAGDALGSQWWYCERGAALRL